MAIHQMFLGLGAVIKKLYQEDLFSIYLWKGDNSSNRTITNGIDLSTEGGMVWIKQRSGSEVHKIYDTVRGATKALQSSSTSSETTQSNGLKSFTTTGFTIGNDNTGNDNNEDYVAWSLRKAPGFFDIVTWNGTGSTKNVPHNLGVTPGAIWIKRRNANENWVCWHRDSEGTGSGDFMKLNTTDQPGGGPAYFGTNPVISSTTFEVNSDNAINQGDMMAYVFAGGGVRRPFQSTNVWNVKFNGTSHTLNVWNSTQAAFGTDDFTVEFWATPWLYSNSPYFLDFRENGSDTGTTDRIVLYIPSSTGKPTFWLNGSARIEAKVPVNKGADNKPNWQHYALVRSGGTTTFYIDGISQGTYSDSTNYTGSGSGKLTIGNRQGSSSQYFKGQLCDLRITKGQALYTANFDVPATALTTTSQGATASNVTLLCCQNSSVTTSTAGTNPFGTASDDTQGPKRWAGGQLGDFVYGDDSDQNLIKCGFYIGNGSNDGPEVHVGWEPSLLIIKAADDSGNWVMVDNMRGVAIGDSKQELMSANLNNGDSNYDVVEFRSTGFKLVRDDYSGTNGSNKRIIYIAIRRPDGYVSKPPELGTGVFALDTGNASSTVPAFDSGFPVDMAFTVDPSVGGNKLIGTRLTGKEFFITNNTTVSDTSDFFWDSNAGCWKNYNSSYQAWMWKRGKGFDTVTYKGNDSTRVLNHSLNAVPEMIWVTSTTSGGQRYVYHSAADGGSSPWTKEFTLGASAGESGSPFWGSSLPTSSTFNIGASSNINSSSKTYVAMLFASVPGISKVGSFTGSSSAKTLTLGFQARFLLIKRRDTNGDWNFFDSQRGMASAPATYGESTFTTSGSHTWTCPSGVSSVSVVCVGGGGEAGTANSNDSTGGGGGALAYKNSISVTAGNNYTVTVGAGGTGASGYDANGVSGGASSFTGYGGTVTAGGGGGGGGGAGSPGSGGSPSGHDGGGSGGNGGNSNPAQGGGGGAGGYSGNGGNGVSSYPGSSGAGSGGAGGGGYQAGGGGVGLGGQGSSGAASNSGNNGKGGSGGEDTTNSTGGNYGGGGSSSSGPGGSGAVRIVWSTDGTTRSFPSTNVATYDDQRLKLNGTAKQAGGDYLNLTSTTVVLTAGQSEININNAEYIYYAHA